MSELTGAEVLHLYGQPFWHAEAYIGGSRDALRALRDAIDAALQDGDGACEAFASDGEGYTVHVVAMNDEDAWRQVVPYTEEPAMQEHHADSFGPWIVLRSKLPAPPAST